MSRPSRDGRHGPAHTAHAEEKKKAEVTHRGEILVLIHMGRRPLLAALVLAILALGWLPFLDSVKQQRENQLAGIAAEAVEKREQMEKLKRDATDLDRLAERFRRWQALGHVAATDRAQWFETIGELAGKGAMIELSPPVPVEGIAGAYRHPVRIELSGLVESEALDLAARLARRSPVPWRLERMVLSDANESGIKLALVGDLLHVDPAAVKPGGQDAPPDVGSAR